MSEKQIRLTPELRKQIVSGIRAGGYPYVAAEAFGVSKDLFDHWLDQGNEKTALVPYRSFAHEVRQAFAQARLRAEIAGYEKDPKLWLVNGPGRESEQRPGWSTSVQRAEAAEEARNVLLDLELMQLLHTLLKVLEPYPEARAQVAQIMMNDGKESAA